MHKARNRLLALLATNSSKPKRFEIVRNEATPDETTIYLYDVIDPFWGVSAKQFVKELNAIKTPTINLRINSPGGDVFDGRAIATAIAQHPSKIVAHIDGLAASAASYVAISAKEVVMAPGTFLMIHNAWTIAFGNKDELQKVAEVLDKIDASLVDTYVAVTGASAEQVKEWMDAETWFTADEAVAEGFADRVSTPAAGEEDKTANAWDLSAYERPAASLLIPNKAEADDDTELLEAQHAARMRRAGLRSNPA
jgi:ATP-dependent Clp protease protease subunit